MGLLSPQDEATLKQHLSSITLKVELILFTQAFGGSETGDVAKQILGEIASLNDKVTVVEKSFVLDTEDKAKYKMAAANPLITADAIEATEFMDLSRKYRVTGVPKTIVNETIEIMGGLPEQVFVRAALDLPEQPEA